MIRHVDWPRRRTSCSDESSRRRWWVSDTVSLASVDGVPLSSSLLSVDVSALRSFCPVSVVEGVWETACPDELGLVVVVLTLEEDAIVSGPSSARAVALGMRVAALELG